MSRAAGVVGHLTLLDEVHEGPWSLVAVDVEHAAGSDVAGWDPEVDVEVRRSLEVDLATALDSLGQGANAVLEVALIWHASGSGMRGASDPKPLVSGVTDLTLALEGAQLGGRLRVECVVMLGVADPQSPLAATQPGAVLWKDHADFHLEGDGSLLQTHSVAFAEGGHGPAEAAWRLMIEDATMDELAGAQVTLLLNSDHPTLGTMLEGEQVDSPVLALLQLEMERRLVEHALDKRKDLDEGREYDEGSFGELLLRAVRRNFPSLSLEEVHRLRQNDRGDFETRLQAAGRFLA